MPEASAGARTAREAERRNPGPRPSGVVSGAFPRGVGPPRPSPAALCLGLLAALLAGCHAPAHGPTLRVSAAASLADAFTELGSAFERTRPEVDVVLNLGASSGLREQILAGAPADVFAPASPTQLDALVEAGLLAGTPRIFARNRLEIAVARGNPAGIAGLADFRREELLLGLCAAPVPCGGLARRALEDAGITASVDTHEPNVRALLTKIEAGELDAGIVYATDVASSPAVEGIAAPEARGVVAEYAIAALDAAPEAAGEFVAFVVSERGRAILSRHGFALP